MSDSIQSISQGNYILHNIDAKKLYVQEPLFTANSGDAVYVGWRPDETVLWSGTTASNSNNNFGGSWNINESLSSFESVDIYHWEKYACPDSARNCFNISRVPIMDNSFFLQIGPYPENTGTANWFNMKVYGEDKQVRISGGFNAFQNQNILLFNSTNMWGRGQVYKIVGINRKENA